MKLQGQSIVQALLVFVATLVVYVTADHFVPPDLLKTLSEDARKAVFAAATSFVVAALYLVLRLLIGIKPFRKLVDKDKARFLGQFVSIHKTGGKVSIFEIKYAQGYCLGGYTYRRDNLSEAGHWTSAALTIDGDTLEYQYKGSKPGYCKIRFNPDIAKGTGYFLEDFENPTRVESGYTRVDSNATKAVLGGFLPKWRLRSEKDRLSFVEGLHKLSKDDPTRYGRLFRLAS